MSEKPDLITFVRERLDEREATARRAARESNGERWSRLQFRNGLPDVAEHAAANDPAYVLRDIAAKRAIVDAYENALQRNQSPPIDAWLAGAVAAGQFYLRCIAAIDAGHPDYNPEWRPS